MVNLSKSREKIINNNRFENISIKKERKIRV